MEERLCILEGRLGYRFRDPDLLCTAMTHTSYLNETTEPREDNQRLEYLGDAVLDLLIAERLFHLFPTAREGDLTRWRAQLVSTEALAGLATALGVGEAMLMGRGEEATGGLLRSANLAATLEALIAAVYLDGGWEALHRVILPLFAPGIERVSSATGPQDARSRLQELVQALYGVTPRYNTVDEQGPDHARTFTVQVLIGDEVHGEGQGHSKRAAAQAAAEQALATLLERAS
ncbi:MAG: ribonuclease III [Anaerolineae bacterium]